VIREFQATKVNKVNQDQLGPLVGLARRVIGVILDPEELKVLLALLANQQSEQKVTKVIPVFQVKTAGQVIPDPWDQWARKDLPALPDSFLVSAVIVQLAPAISPSPERQPQQLPFTSLPD
jgi:hypothetical protein